jgi:outer membrane biosynthesis protein TonB
MMSLARIALTAAALSLGALLAGCDTFDPTAIFDAEIFNTKKKLQGERKPVFPDGTPGVPQGVPQELVKGYQATEPEPPPPAPEPKAEAKPKPKPKVVAKPKEQPAPAAAQPPQSQAQSQWPDAPPAQQSRPAAGGAWPSSPQPSGGGVAWPDPPQTTR